MQSFLEETLNTIYKEYTDVSSLILILPSKRAGGFLKNILRQTTQETIFSPKIISIEEFIEELSDLKIIDNTELLFKSYKAYLNTETLQEKDSFENYTSWASTLLSDFNEIDRYLVDPEPFFNYLSSIQDINHWYVNSEKTTLIESYLNFWDNLHEFYDNLRTDLLSNKLGYQGMVYRKAVEDIEHYCLSNGNRTHIFIGFNALNNAEQQIFQGLLETQNTKVYWDIDSHFYNDQDHSASHFIRQYVREWKYFQHNEPIFIRDNFQKKKHIQFIAAQKNIAQAKFVGQILSEYSQQELNNTAVVLADEKLLLPILHSLPNNVTSVNITMGVVLKEFPITSFFEMLLALHLHNRSSFYYKSVLSILNHPLAVKLLPNVYDIIDYIGMHNISYLSLDLISELSKNKDISILNLLFGNWNNDGRVAISNCIKLMHALKVKMENNHVERAALHQLFAVFSKIETLNKSYPYLTKIQTVHSLFTDFVTSTTLDFKGDAYSGLQIMGVLETRVLDFENVIITSVNEGVLPAGKSNASFITYDLKQQFDLPNYTEKDAIYTYHFYHMLHRSKNVSLLYNNHSEGLNAGEMSRFLLQLDVEKHPNHELKKIVLNPKIEIENKTLKEISKTKAVCERLQEIAEAGFSPSSLTSYIRNPLDFYFQNILKIKEFEEVEETVAAKTLGTIVHDTLEAFYKPLKSSFLTSEVLSSMKKRIDAEVRNQFDITFKSGLIDKGKNLIVFEVAKRYVSNFIDYELDEIKAGNKIKILQIESKLDVEIPISELDFPVKIRGKVDRVDEYNGRLRIIDYKTGKVQQSDLEIIDWGEITRDYKYSKVVQVLAYALMINDHSPIQNAEAGIISFKNLNNGFLKFATKSGARSPRNYEISSEVLSFYLQELKKLILEICDPSTPFIEKEV